MKLKDIATGTLYAKGTRSGQYYTPVLVLDTSTMWKCTTGHDIATPVWETTDATSAGRYAYGYIRVTTVRWGLLAAVGRSTHKRDPDQVAEAARRWLAMVADPHTLTPATVAALAAAAPEGIKITIIEPRELAGKWDGTLADAARVQRERVTEAARERERLESVAARVDAVWRERFGEGATFDYDVYTDEARIPIDRLAALIGLNDD